MSAYRTIDYNKSAIQEWSGRHWLKHDTYFKEMHRRGAAINPVALEGPINADWFGRHMLNHMALMQLTNLSDSSYNLGSLSTPWDPTGEGDEQVFHDWMYLHDRIHSKIDRQLAIVTRG
jgi:hypothetical protein